MKRSLFTKVGLLLVVAMGLTLPALAGGEAPVVSTDELVALLHAPAQSSDIGTPEPTSTAGFSCPSYTIPCTKDSQCDSYCGTPGWGVCDWMQSAGRRCCFCLG